MKFIYLEADQTAAQQVPSFFEGSGYEVVLASALEDAIFAMQREVFEVALVSVHEPAEKSLQWAHALVSQFPQLHLGLVADPNQDAAVRPFAAGLSLGILEKPLTPERLTRALQAPQGATVDTSAIETGSGGGGLSSFSLVDVIQMSCIGQKTGRLRVRFNELSGEIYFQAGAVVHASIPGLEGEDAVYEMVAWDGAEAELDEAVASPKMTISAGWEHLLMEGVRRKDERGATAPQDLSSVGDLIGKMVGPFRVKAKIAADYWGSLYEALQVAVNRPVALKILNPSFYADQEAVQQFISFAGAMARAQNPYITTVYEAGQGSGLIFYAREHVEGANLKDRLARGQILSEELAIRVIINVGTALYYEQRNNILHTPLTVDQVLIPNEGVPKLLNNVTLEGAEMSAGEIDEMIRLGMIVKQGMEGAQMATPEFKSFLERMLLAGKGGFCGWDELLREAHKMDLNRRAMQVTRPLGTHHKEIEFKPEPVIQPWMKIAFAVMAVAIIVGFYLWYFYFRFMAGGAKDVNAQVSVPAGEFIYQSGEKVTLPEFFIDKYEVTIGQYQKFLDAWNKNRSSIKEHPKRGAGKDHTPQQWDSIRAAIKNGTKFQGSRIFNNTPVFNVDFFDAWAYAQWAGKRLPTEQEWEKAGRGPKGNLYPWGNNLDESKANTGADFTDNRMDPSFGARDGWGLWSPVGAEVFDKSDYGVMDMAGNVSEWTDSWATNPDFPTEQVPVVRGGNWNALDAKLTQRDLKEAVLKRSLKIGFRCVSDKPVVSPSK